MAESRTPKLSAQAAEAALRAALRSAQADAQPVYRTVPAKGPDPDDNWNFAPYHEVAREAQRLLTAHDLNVDMRRCEVVPIGRPDSVVGSLAVEVEYQVEHKDGGHRTTTMRAPLMMDRINMAVGVGSTESYLWRCFVLRLLGIPVLPVSSAPAREARPVTAPLPPPPIAPVQYSPLGLTNLYAAWTHHEESLAIGKPFVMPTIEDAFEQCLRAAGQAPERRRPANDREREALFFYLYAEAQSHGFLREVQLET